MTIGIARNNTLIFPKS